MSLFNTQGIGYLGAPPVNYNIGAATLPAANGSSSNPSASTQLSAYGVNLTPPNPISYALSGNQGSIANIMQEVNDAQNQANQANTQRYGQELGVLTNAGQQQQGLYGQALGSLNSGYGSAQGALSGSLANDQTIADAQRQELARQTQQASSAAQQSAISRGLNNTTIPNAMQDEVQRAANDANTNISAMLAGAQNSVYSNQANMFANQGNAAANLTAQQGNQLSNNAGQIANAVQEATNAGPNLSQYAQLVQAAAAANRSMSPNSISTTNPVPLNGYMGQLDSAHPSGSGGGTAGGQGGFVNQSSPQGGIGTTTGGGPGAYVNMGAQNQQPGTIAATQQASPATGSYTPTGSGSITSGDQTTSINDGQMSQTDTPSASDNPVPSAASGNNDTKSAYLARCHQFGIMPNDSYLASLPD